MKLTQSEDSGVQIISVTGNISRHEVDVLKAGVNRFFRAGRNRIILELIGSEKIEEAVIRELGLMNLAARELSGEIAIVVSDDVIRAKIDSFSKPKAVWTFAQKAAALKTLNLKAAAESDDEASEPAYFHKMLEAKDGEIQELKAQLKQSAGGEAQSLKSEVSRLKNENLRAQERLQALLMSSEKVPPESHSAEKIQVLESQIEVLLKKLETPLTKATGA